MRRVSESERERSGGLTEERAALLAQLRPELAGLVAPQMPADSVGIDRLAEAYALRAISDRRRVLTWMIGDAILAARALRGEGSERSSSAQQPVRVLDVGCGRGIGLEPRFTRAVGAWADELWGVEPDPGITPEPRLFANYQNALLEDAALEAGAFDVAYCYMVVEHLVDPARFLAAAARCLRPGGQFLFVTVNAKHYFTRAAAAARAARIDEALLRLLRGKQVEEYHYPVQYRCNSDRQIRQHALAAGFTDVTLAYSEEEGPAPYLPGPLRPVLWAMNLKRRVVRDPTCLLSLYARLRKP